MIYEILEKYAHIWSYDKDKQINNDFFTELLYRSWKVTPSKNNFMPYKIHVLNPQHINYKNKVYDICVRNQTEVNKKNTKNAQSTVNPNFRHLLNCNFMLIFTVRPENQPNRFQSREISQGAYYEACHSNDIDSILDLISLEVGLFASTLTSLCLENGMHTSYIKCFSKKIEIWKDLEFIKTRPILIMTSGYADVKRQDVAKKQGWANDDLKPDFDRIVNFVTN